mgnify:FL=1
MAQRMDRLGPPTATGGLLGKLQARIGLPSFRGNYSPAQFKEPYYGGREPLQAEVGKAKSYAAGAGLPKLPYEHIWRENPLFQSSGLDQARGFVTDNSDWNNVFMGENAAAKFEGGNVALPLGKETGSHLMQTGSLPNTVWGSMLSKLSPSYTTAQLRNYRALGSLARSHGLPQTPDAIPAIRDKAIAAAVSGGNPNDDVRDPAGILEHELGHTWLQSPEPKMRKIGPFSEVAEPGQPWYDLESRNNRAAYALNGVGSRNAADLPTWKDSLVGHDSNLPELLNYGSALQQHQFKNTGKRLESPQEVRSWMDSLLSAPDEPTFEQNLKPYPFDVRRMMRHNWRLQSGRNMPEKQEMLNNMKKRMELWFPSLVQNRVGAPQAKLAYDHVKLAAVGKLIAGLSGAARFGARVPVGQTFRAAPVRNLTRLAVNPYFGPRGQIPKRLLQGAGVLTGISGGLALRGHIQQGATEADAVIPPLPKLQPLKSYLGDLKTSPIWTSLRTAFGGLPESIPAPQRSLIQSLADVGLRNKLHGKPAIPSATDWVQRAYMPAKPALESGAMGMLRHYIPAPSAKDYGDLIRRTGAAANDLF